MDLAITILNDKINDYINHINTHDFSRKFDNKCDEVCFSLTPRQFYIVEKYFKLKIVSSIFGVKINDFQFNDYAIITRYNDRMNHYELRARHKDFIEDIDERSIYIDETYFKEED
jgi:hypothetical protein